MQESKSTQYLIHSRNLTSERLSRVTTISFPFIALHYCPFFSKLFIYIGLPQFGRVLEKNNVTITVYI